MFLYSSLVKAANFFIPNLKEPVSSALNFSMSSKFSLKIANL